MLAPTISPHDPNLVVEHCDMTGGYITRDGGQSWRMFGLRSVIETFAFDPRDAKVIYAGNAALWRSDDAGRSWRMAFPNPARNTVEHQNGDHSGYSLTSEDPTYSSNLRITAIVVAPADSKTIHVAFSNGRRGASGLVVSLDGGVTFRREHEFPADRILLLHHGAKGLLVIGTSALYRHVGEAWEALPSPKEPLSQVSAGESDHTTCLYATTSKGALLLDMVHIACMKKRW